MYFSCFGLIASINKNEINFLDCHPPLFFSQVSFISILSTSKFVSTVATVPYNSQHSISCKSCHSSPSHSVCNHHWPHFHFVYYLKLENSISKYSSKFFPRLVINIIWAKNKYKFLEAADCENLYLITVGISQCPDSCRDRYLYWLQDVSLHFLFMIDWSK